MKLKQLKGLSTTQTILMMLIVSYSFAQKAANSVPVGSDANSNLADANSSMFRSFDNRYEGVVGKSTIFDEFVYGTIVLKDSTRVVDQELNYDAIADELLVDSKKFRRVMAVRKDQFVSFDVEMANPDGETKVLHFIRVDGIGTVEVIYDGKTKFYRKHMKQLVKATYGGAYNSNGKNFDEFVDASTYVIVKPGGQPMPIKLSKKTIEALYSDQAKEFKAISKEAKLNFKKREDVIEFLRYIDAKN